MTTLPDRPPTTHGVAPRNQRTSTRQVISSMAVVLLAGTAVGAVIHLVAT